MRFLLDSNLSPRVAVLLRAGGMDAEHVRDHGLQAEPDEVILQFARERGLVVISEDTDFGELLARQRAAAPSFLLLRTNGPMPPDEHAAQLLRNIPQVLADLEAVLWSCSAAIESECVGCRCCPRYRNSARHKIRRTAANTS